MTELSDYQRMVERPHLEKLQRTIRAQSDEIERLRAALLLARRAILKESAADEQIALNDIDQLLGAVAVSTSQRAEK